MLQSDDIIMGGIPQLIKANSKLLVLNLRDNMIRDIAADQIVKALSFNSNIVKLPFDLNPVKHAVFIDIDTITTRNQINSKELVTPTIKNEINAMRAIKD